MNAMIWTFILVFGDISMEYYGKIAQENLLQPASDIQKVEMGLKKGEFSHLLHFLKPVLETLFEDDKSRIKPIIEQFKRLHIGNQRGWGHILAPLVSDIIRHTDGGTTRFFENESFPWVSDAEHYYKAARAELETALVQLRNIPAFQEIQEEQMALTNDDKWKVIALKGFGKPFSENIALFPATMELLNQIPDWTSAMYSILVPGKQIPPHKGVYNGVLRYHLGISVPENCAIEVGGETRSWTEGGSLIFDDSLEHSAWNKSAENRTVLFVDFLRPLPFPLNILNKWLVLDVMSQSEFIKKATKNSYKYDAFQKEQTKLYSER